eukprot:364868-Chlamydomonas_euryale.AAC.13
MHVAEGAHGADAHGNTRGMGRDWTGQEERLSHHLQVEPHTYVREKRLDWTGPAARACVRARKGLKL